MNGSYQEPVSETTSSTTMVPRERFESFIRISKSAMWSLDSETVYQRMVDTLSVELDCADVNMYLLTVTGDRLTECAFHGYTGKKGRQLPITIGRTQRMMATHRPIIVDFLNPHREDRMLQSGLDLGYRSAASIPLVADDEALGMYCLSYKQSKRWTEHDISYLLAIGRLLGGAVRQTQMVKKATELQTLIERKRLSAEIHDNLSQLISLLKISAETAQISYEEGDDTAVQRNLQRMVTTSGEALKVLREEILYLRTSSGQARGLPSIIEECLARFNAQWDIGAELEVKGLPESVVVSLQAELQITRILHESLSNTLRHAGATRVSVVLKGDEKYISMLVYDNGKGFDVDAIPVERLGIRIMQERAESLRGKLTIQSGKEQGTMVRVDVPRSVW